MTHFRAVHKELHCELVLNDNNSTEDMITSTIQQARQRRSQRVSRKTISRFFRPTRSSSAEQCVTSAAVVSASVPKKTLHAVGLVLYACLTERSFESTSSPLTQGFVDICEGHM